MDTHPNNHSNSEIAPDCERCVTIHKRLEDFLVDELDFNRAAYISITKQICPHCGDIFWGWNAMNHLDETPRG